MYNRQPGTHLHTSCTKNTPHSFKRSRYYLKRTFRARILAFLLLLPTPEKCKAFSISALWQMDQTCGSLNSLYSRYESTLQEIIAEKKNKHAPRACLNKRTNKNKDAHFMNKYE